MGKQKTIKNKFSISGVGLHTGCHVSLTFKPAKENSGIQFIRVDLPDKPLIKAIPENIIKDAEIPRCTSIGNNGTVIHTVEHLMSVLCGMGIDNLIVEIDEKELPGLDGSGLDFITAFKKSGIVEQNDLSEAFDILDPIGVEHNGSSIYIIPSDELKISYTLDYNHPFLGSQFFSTVVTNESFEKEIAPCRTFCLESEAFELQNKGLGKGANYDNTLVVGDEGVKENKVRFPNEFARHKVLDFIGDLYLLGVPIRGHVYAIKSGHTLNIALLRKIAQQREEFFKRPSPTGFSYEGGSEINIDNILKVLPHRYPFLLVDRVIEIEKGKKALGIKNVTINDNFFRGHFPTRPIMPGVLMVEAMAQTAGVVVLTNEAHHGKVAVFMAADNVKFRKVVEPGDQLVMEVEVLRDKARFGQIRGVARVGKEIVCEADMTFSYADASFLH